MNIQIEKLQLIEWILGIKDRRVIKKVKEIQDRSGDWADDVSAGVLASVERGIKDAKAGRVHSHAVVKKRYAKWLKD